MGEWVLCLMLTTDKMRISGKLDKGFFGEIAILKYYSIHPNQVGHDVVRMLLQERVIKWMNIQEF